jgi:hypothetical protein
MASESIYQSTCDSHRYFSSLAHGLEPLACFCCLNMQRIGEIKAAFFIVPSFVQRFGAAALSQVSLFSR